MTGVAWGSAYADGVGPTIRIALVFVLGHFLGTSLLVSTLMYFLVGRVLGKRRQGLFGPPTSGEEGLEFGYCFDVRLADLPILLDILLTWCPGLYPCFPATLGLPIRATIPVHAADRA
jgi:hypothetical protein